MLYPCLTKQPLVNDYHPYVIELRDFPQHIVCGSNRSSKVSTVPKSLTQLKVTQGKIARAYTFFDYICIKWWWDFIG